MMIMMLVIMLLDYSYAERFISTIAGTGSSGYSGDGGAATSAKLNNPFGVALDSSGNVYIADSGNHRIRMIDAISGNISTIAGTGSGGYSGDGGAATSARLKYPTGVVLDSSGNVYIADSYNNRIRNLTPTCAAGQYWRGFPPCLPCPGGKFSSSIGRYLTFIVVSVYICLYDIY